MTNRVTFEEYLRYTRRQSSVEEARAVRAWLADPANAWLAQEWMQRYVQLRDKEESTVEMPDFEAIQNQLLARIGLAPAPTKQRHVARAWTRWAAAAVVLLGLLAGSAWFWQSALAPAPALAAVATAYGERRTVPLPDGSLVKLNSHSTLRYATTLGRSQVREVWLDGEGFFSVRHMPDNQRFVVHTTAGFSVEVLGTQFTVLRRRARAQVVLLTGKVRVDFDDKTRSQEVILKPGELLETSDAQPRRIVHKAVKVAPYAAWKDDKLVFDETPMAEVATRLTDTYGVRVVVQGPALAQRRISGTFPVGDLDATLLVLEKTFHLAAHRAAQQITLSPQP